MTNREYNVQSIKKRQQKQQTHTAMLQCNMLRRSLEGTGKSYPTLRQVFAN